MIIYKVLDHIHIQTEIIGTMLTNIIHFVYILRLKFIRPY